MRQDLRAFAWFIHVVMVSVLIVSMCQPCFRAVTAIEHETRLNRDSKAYLRAVRACSEPVLHYALALRKRVR